MDKYCPKNYLKMILHGLKKYLILINISRKAIMMKRMKRYLFEADIQYSENLHNLFNNLLVLSERIKLKKFKKLFQTFLIKNNILY